MKKTEQVDRFKDTVREVGADTSDDALDKVMVKLDYGPMPERVGS